MCFEKRPILKKTKRDLFWKETYFEFVVFEFYFVCQTLVKPNPTQQSCDRAALQKNYLHPTIPHIHMPFSSTVLPFSVVRVCQVPLLVVSIRVIVLWCCAVSGWCNKYGIPVTGCQPSAASAQITVQMMPSSLLAGTQLYWRITAVIARSIESRPWETTTGL